jgi:DNA helicase HerA-like ATPase
MPPISRNRLGVVTSGSLVEGLCARLEGRESVEDMGVGKFVVIKGEKHEFFSMITDVVLEATNQKVLVDPPNGDLFIHEVLAGTSTYGSIKLKPMLMLPRDLDQGLLPVKTIPHHFAAVQEADESDFQRVFGGEDATHFEVGRPLDMDVPVCIDLERLVERSNGIFGKSGTGKSFLTRLMLAGVIQRDAAVNLIFDMHNEYGWQARSERRDMPVVKGLKQLFGGDVVVFTLDPESTSRRGISGAHEVLISLDQIEIADLALLKDELNLSEAAIESALILREGLGGSRWLSRFLEMTSGEIEGFVEQGKGHAGALKALQRKLIKVTELSYIRTGVPYDAIEAMLKYIDQGKHVILEFGSQNTLLSYMLAANIITRRIHGRYVKRCDEYYADPLNVAPPKKLMITIEEAHKFLAPAIAKQTIFGTIAREMRKYFVTLLIVDQRPSGIDAEVLSQVGTRITALLNDDKDIDAVFTGVSGGQNLRTVLSQLDPKQQALVMGYAVPMPVVVRTRDYDEAFYAAMAAGRESAAPEEKAKRGKRHMATLWPA